MVSAPYKPFDVLEQRDPNSIFKKLSYHYSVGLGKDVKNYISNIEIDIFHTP
jgi:hypothetical protein